MTDNNNQAASSPDSSQTELAKKPKLEGAGVVKLGKRLASQKSCAARIPTKRAKLDSDEALNDNQILLSANFDAVLEK